MSAASACELNRTIDTNQYTFFMAKLLISKAFKAGGRGQRDLIGEPSRHIDIGAEKCFASEVPRASGQVGNARGVQSPSEARRARALPNLATRTWAGNVRVEAELVTRRGTRFEQIVAYNLRPTAMRGRRDVAGSRKG